MLIQRAMGKGLENPFKGNVNSYVYCNLITTTNPKTNQEKKDISLVISILLILFERETINFILIVVNYFLFVLI